MSRQAFKVEPFAEHVPDSGPDDQHKNPGSVEQGAGQIELGFYIGDHRIVLSSLKAGAFTDLFEKGDPTSGKLAKGLAKAGSSSKKQPAEGDSKPDGE